LLRSFFIDFLWGSDIYSLIESSKGKNQFIELLASIIGSNKIKLINIDINVTNIILKSRSKFDKNISKCCEKHQQEILLKSSNKVKIKNNQL
jgi:hypothetical protein